MYCSLFYNINTGSIEDFTGRGLLDLHRGIIATPLPPKTTFLDDPLRVLRAVRFAARFDYKIQEDLREAAADLDVRTALLNKVSPERVGVEIDLMITGANPVRAVRELVDLGLFWIVFRLPQALKNNIPDELQSLHDVEEPLSFDEAKNSKNWMAAMQSEYDALKENDTWTLCDLPPGKKAIDTKWVYKLKRKPDAHFDWDVHQSDIAIAFLNGDIFEEVYVTQPRGFVKKGQGDKVCKCNKALLGLKESPRARYEKVDTHLVKRDFCNSATESTLYVKREGDVFLIVVHYVDDLLIIGANERHIAEFMADLNATFKIKDLGLFHRYLDIQFKQCDGGIVT
ncbi:hypothetical protein L7F22_046433 [Adiantum nelumboides]|nr:hypothetical protein [Adiantum nelumboides]